MNPYPIELRTRVLSAREKGLSQQKVAELFSVSVRWIQHLERQQREEGNVQPRGHGGGRAKAVDAAGEKRLAEVLKQYPDATLEELKVQCDLDASLSSICRALSRMGWNRKKKTFRYAEQKRPDVAAERKAFRLTMPQLNAEDLVFLDESNAKTNMARLYGRAPDGQRVFDSVPDARYESVTMLSALTFTGVGPSLTYKGGTDVGAMLTYVRSLLLPTLTKRSVVLMDNLSSHKDDRVIEAIQSSGATVRFLPRYSPDFNPIEQMWSKVKTHLRSFAARTKACLDEAISYALRTVNEADAKGWIGEAGYITNT